MCLPCVTLSTCCFLCDCIVIMSFVGDFPSEDSLMTCGSSTEEKVTKFFEIKSNMAEDRINIDLASSAPPKKKSKKPETLADLE